MDVGSDRTASGAVAASSGDGDETKNDGRNPKPVGGTTTTTTELLKGSGSSQLENGSDDPNPSANSLSPEEKMDVTSEKSLSPPVLTKETDNTEQNGGKKENREKDKKDNKDTEMEVDPQDPEPKMEDDHTDSDQMSQPPSLDKAKDSSPQSNAPTLNRADDNERASVDSKKDIKEETQSNHEEEKGEKEKGESEKKEKEKTNKEVKSDSGRKKEESDSESKDKTTAEMKEDKDSENDSKKKDEDDDTIAEDMKEDDDKKQSEEEKDEKKENEEKTNDEKTKESEEEKKDKDEKSEENDAKDSSAADQSKTSDKSEAGRISPRRTRSQNRTKPSVATYLEDDFDDEDDLDLQITAVSGGVDGQLTGKPTISRAGKSDSKGGSKSSKSIQKCIVCHKVGKCKYNIVRNGDIKHLCDDECFRQFRVNPTVYLRTPSSPSSTSSPVPTSAALSSQLEAPPAPAHYKTCSVCQLMNINTNKHFLNWQGLDFCGEECLGKFQSSLGGTCSFCGSQVQSSAKAKYCLKLGTEIKQFCGTQCHAQFKKRLKVCSYCQKDLTNVSDSFMAPVGWEQGVFKDFCSQSCLGKYEEKNNKDVEIIGVEQTKKSHPCAVCGKVSTVKHEIKFEGKVHKMCSDPCFSAFQYANKLTMNTCDNCGVYCYNEGMQPQYIQFEGNQKRFCSYMCVNTFRALNKKVVSCAWCGSKKSNFDMIERVDANNKYQLFCSLNCLSLYRVNLQATSNQAVTCDQCRKFVPAQYHLTMSDASVRNFCSYNCVMGFQSQFSSPSSGGASGTSTIQSKTLSTGQISTSKSSRPATRSGLRQQTVGLKSTTQVPVIISQTPSPSPAQSQKSTSLGITSTGSGSSTPLSVSSSTSMVGSSISTSTGNQIIIQPPQPKQVKNKSLLCKPFVQTKATSCRPHTQSKEVQTDGEAEAKTIFVPVPVPIYVPVPMPMYNTVTPFPFPVPLPVPIPCFIPTTKKSSASILKHIKEIQEKIPADPFEAELLMMAEAVANAEQSSTDDDEDTEQPGNEIDGDEKITNTIQGAVSAAAAAAAAVDAAVAASTPQRESFSSPNIVGNCNKDFDDEVLRMSLNITAAEISSEPSLDLESFLEFTPPLGTSNSTSDLKNRADLKSKQVGRGGNKRAAVTGGRGGRRNKRIRVVGDGSPLLEGEGDPADGQRASPDSNMHLKYTYGVYAWRQWVVQKNAQLEKVSKSGPGRLKLFKTDLLQCTPDELNYSLCLFVKEVRKPNKEEYSPDSIHYLCLGIQQYLFENGRIDNIFTDMYYEKFTECLNEILMRYEPRVNGLGQLVCRIEEEHLWECKQLGAHSPHVLLNTLIYFNTKHFLLKNPDDHIKLSFTHIMKHWKKGTPGKGGSGRCVYLRYYCNAEAINQKKRREELPVYEQCENMDNPLRCPVKLYEFYLSKCPESIKNRNDVFYLIPERSCVPDSPVWYSTQSLSSDLMTKMLNRIRLVKEIQEAAMNTQPVYV